MARDPFLTLDSGGDIGDVKDFTLEGGGGGGRFPAGFVGIAELAENDFDEGGGGGIDAGNLGGVRIAGEGDLEESGDGECRTLRSGDIDNDLRLPGLGGTVLLLGEVEGDVGRNGDMVYGDISGDFV